MVKVLITFIVIIEETCVRLENSFNKIFSLKHYRIPHIAISSFKYLSMFIVILGNEYMHIIQAILLLEMHSYILENNITWLPLY